MNKTDWAPQGTSHRYHVSRDTVVSSVGTEKNSNKGGSYLLKLKGQQEFTLMDLEVTDLKGKIITGVLMHLNSAVPVDAPLKRIGVSTVASQWEEGTRLWYRPQKGAASFNQAYYTEKNWAYPGSTLLDVVFGKGNTIWKFSEATVPDPDNWQTIAVDPDVIASRLAGLSYGVCLSDEVGSEWNYDKGQFNHILFPNRYFHGRKKFIKQPWFEIWTQGEDHIPPETVDVFEVDHAGLSPGQVLVRWNTPSDKGGGKTLGFNISYTDAGEIKPMPQYLIPMAGNEREQVVMLIQDLGMKPNQKTTITIRAVDSCGNIGKPYSQEIATAPASKPVPKTLWGNMQKTAALNPIAVGDLKVLIIDMLDKIDPVTGEFIQDKLTHFSFNNHLFNYDKKKIIISSTRNETVGFQVNLSGSTKKATIQCIFNDSEQLRPKLYEYGYVSTTDPEFRFLPDPLLPSDGFISIPSTKENLDFPEQKNHSVLCEIYVPHGQKPGINTGKLVISSETERVEVPIEVRIHDVTLPNKLSFIPEMNAYGTANPYLGYQYYRLAHEHRTCLNRLPYGWDGKPAFAPDIIDDEFDWQVWDERVGPLLDGSAFYDLPRANEPVDVFYLPFNENWPVRMIGHYTCSYWADESFSDEYAEKLINSFRAFQVHFNTKGWSEPVFQFYLNNKVTYRKKNRLSTAPWFFDEPVNTQDFWALRWYGELWKKALQPNQKNKIKMWYRADISYSEFGRDILQGISNIEYLGGNNNQKVRMINDRKRIHDNVHFAEYGSANKINEPNIKIVQWCLNAWFRGATGVLPWQTIGSENSRKEGEDTALFYPHPDKPVASGRLKAFMIGQQLIEYFTIAGVFYDIPRSGFQEWFNHMVSMNKGYLDTTLLCDVKNELRKLISKKKYKRSWVELKYQDSNYQSINKIGLVSPAPIVPSSKPDCRSLQP